MAESESTQLLGVSFHPSQASRMKAVIQVDGMRCYSYINNIKEIVGSKPGIFNVGMSFPDRQVVVEFDGNSWDAQEIADVIESMGLEARVSSTCESEGLIETSLPSSSSSYEEAYIEVRGMTCQSCVKNIQDHIGSKNGIETIEVSLSDGEAYVTFDKSKWTGESVAQAIDDMGYDAKLKAVSDSVNTSAAVEVLELDSAQSVDPTLAPEYRKAALKVVNQPVNGLKVEEKSGDGDKSPIKLQMEDSIKKCTISIEGMTCASCVAYIERNIGKVKGVESIVVALMASKAEVIYDSNVIDVNQIVTKITQLGYNSTLLECGSTVFQTTNLQLGDLDNPMDAKRIESRLLERKGIESCTVLPANSTASIEYSPTVIGPRDIIKIIEDLGYSAVLLESNQKLKRFDQSIEISKWRSSLLISLFFGIPVMGIMVYFHWCLRTAMNPDNQIPVVLPAISLDNLLLFILCTPVQVLGGRYFYVKSWKALKHKTSNMDVLIVLATSIAYFYSIIALVVAVFCGWPSSPMTFFDVPPMLIVFISLGRWLEYKAKGRTSEALSKLMSLQAKEAVLITLDENSCIVSEERIDIDLVQRADVIKILPGAKIPMDGVVIQGKSSVDESFITGEFMPVMKKTGSPVISGSVNGNGTLLVRVTHVSHESTLAQIVRLVEHAQTSKAPIQQAADRIAGYFVPVVIGLAFFTLLGWIIVGYFVITDNYLTANERLEAILKRAFEAAITVLAIACPCSLGLATPTAVMVGTGIGASNGILIKGGEALETAHNITTLVFDKTGTITEGCPTVVGVQLLVSHQHLPLRKMLGIIGSAESNSEHPIASSITSFVKEFLLANNWGVTQRFRASAGSGLSCEVTRVPNSFLALTQEDENISARLSFIGATVRLKCNDVEVRQACFTEEGQEDNYSDSKPFKVVVGNERWLIKNGIPVDETVSNVLAAEQSKGFISVLCAINGIIYSSRRCVAVLSITDKIKQEAKLAVWGLRKMGIHVILLTGDNSKTAEVTARQVGINEVFAEVLPNQKQLKIEQLQNAGEVVAMVGDGINDSPALARADVGIAIAAGSDVAVESAGIVLVKNNLIDVVGAIKLSKKTTRRIHLNFLFAVLYNAIGIPVAAGVFLPFGFFIQPWMAAAAMAMSSVSVLSSSLLLKTFRRPTKESLASLEFRKYEAEIMMGNFSVKVHRGLDDTNVKRTNSKVSIASLLSGISGLFGSQQSVNRVRPKDRSDEYQTF
ncbi:unnamed protein product [Enterobius vermicularis]|uniref:P-type Cu(+) transporter n=1 Tax=Enterobius vermicularis TaxID=51028 RepID=A0A0N4VJS2_ENTVE|nr:unnamed protein product [Enterobius vermicularis]